MAKGKYTSKFTSVTAELFNDYYEDTTTVIRRKMANNATSQPKTNSTKQNKAVLSSKPQKKVNNLKKQNNNANKKVVTQSLKQTASFLNNKQKYQQEFPTLGQSYKTQSVQKPQSKPQQQLKQKPQQLKQKSQQQMKKQPQKLSNKFAAPRTYRSPATYTVKQTEELLRQFYSICQSYNGMNYFGKAIFQNNCWSKNKQHQWVNSASALALKNAPVVRRIQRQASKKQPMQQTHLRQASAKKQPMKQMSKQNEGMFLREFSEICQCFNGMNYFGKSSFQSNTWSKNRQHQWVSNASVMALKNAPIVRRIQRQTSVKKQPVQQKARQAPVKKQPVQQKARQAPIKKQPVQQKARQAPIKKQPMQQKKMKKQQRKMMPNVNNAITMEQKEMNQMSIVAQQNASMKLQNQILKKFQEKQQQMERKKKLQEQQKLKQQQQMKMQKKMSVKKIQSIKQTVKKPESLKKQQMEKEKKRVQKLQKGKKMNNTPKRNVRQLANNGMTRSQAKKMRKRQALINTINKRIQELVAEKHQKQLFSQMVKQKTEQILEAKHEASIQKSMNNFKKASTSKIQEKEVYEKQQKRIQKKLAKQKGQIKKNVSKKSSTTQKLEAQRKKQLAELKNKLSPEQFSKIHSIMQRNGNNTKEQNERQMQSEQAKKNWQEQVRRMKARQQEIQQKQEKQTLIKKRFESIKRKLTPKQQENLMNNLKMKEQQKMKKSELKNRQPRANNNNKKFAKRQAPVRKQVPVKQQPIKPAKQMTNKKQMTKKTEVWTFVNNSRNAKVQKPVPKAASKGVKQFKTVSSRKFNASETRMFNNEFSELCNVFECTKYVTYSNYKTWSKNKSGNYVSNASVISARNAPRITRGGLSKQMSFGGKKMNNKIQNAKPQQVRNKKSNKSRY